MKALIAVDGSNGSFEAVRQASELLSPERDQVAFYYSPPGLRVDGPAPDEQVLARVRQSLAEAIFAEARARLGAAWTAEVHTIVGHSPAGQGVTAAADLWHADMIAVGARGLGPIQRLLLGSVSRSVVQASSVPVLVARPRPETLRHAGWRVLVACKSQAAGQDAARLLGQLSFPPDSVGRAISIVQPMFAGQIPAWLEEQARSSETEAMAASWMQEHAAELAEKQAEMTDYCRQLPEVFHQRAPIVAEGHPAEVILKTVASENIDLLVVGAKQAGSVARLLLGSTSEAVLGHAPCSVLVVRRTPQP